MIWVAWFADSDWVAEQFAAIIAANWPAEPGPVSRLATTVLAVRARRDRPTGRLRLRGHRLEQLAYRSVEPGRPHQRSPPRRSRRLDISDPPKKNRPTANGKDVVLSQTMTWSTGHPPHAPRAPASPLAPPTAGGL